MDRVQIQFTKKYFFKKFFLKKYNRVKKEICNQSGISLIELLLSLFIMLVAFLANIQLISFSARQLSQVTKKSQLKTALESFQKDIQSNVSRYQVCYSCKGLDLEALENKLIYENLPFALSREGVFVPVAGCTGCLIRFGFLLYPSGTTNFFKLKVRASSPSYELVDITRYIKL